MALLGVANLVYGYGDNHLLDGVNLTLDAGEHVGLVGRNGCGKSTLLRLIAGDPRLGQPISGQIQVARTATAGYLTQDPVLNPEATLREEAGAAFAALDALHAELEQVAEQMASADGDALDKLLKRYEQLEQKMHAAGGYAVEHRIEETLHGLGLGDELFDVKCRDLSGGQKGRLALAKLLLSQPDILLLDEPTNHLDIAGRQWLEEFLAQYGGAVLLISHDRWMLDRVVRKIYELERGRLVEYPGNYQKYRELRDLRHLEQERAFEKQQTKIKQEQAFIDRYRAGQRAKQARGRESKLQRYIRDELLERPAELDVMKLNFQAIPRCGDHVIRAEHLTKGYEGKPLFQDLNLDLPRGTRLGVIGPNGAGKSTLIRCLLGEQKADAGQVKLGAGVNVGHFRQTHEHLDLSHTVVEHLRPFVPGETEQGARDLAGAFLFTGGEQDKPLSALSGGERARAVLASLIAGAHNLLVLDEPTNHLDIPSAERLEEALRQYAAPPKAFTTTGTKSCEGTLIVITHDRALLDNLVDQLLVLDGDGNVEVFLGTYSDYLAEQQQQAERAAAQRQAEQEREAARAKAAAAKVAAKKPAPAAQPAKNAPRRRSSPFGNLDQEKLEAKIEQIESRLSEIDFELAHPDTYKDAQKVKSLQTERDRLRTELKPLEEEWASRA